MGVSKATLPFGDELMLQRVVRRLGEAVRPIVVVAAPSQQLPPLPAHVLIARDQHEGRGPLEGLRAGLTAIRGLADAAYATSCDVPLLLPAFVSKMVELLHGGEYEISVPKDREFHHPLAAVYCVSLLPQIEWLLAADRRRPAFLFECCRTLEVPVDELRSVDPELATLQNLNTPADYRAALVGAGFAAGSG
jgi:molybdopterin-guanine dinucleotide biosynthesis protein A